MNTKAVKVLSPKWAEQPAPITDAGRDREACQLCSLYSTCRAPYRGAYRPAGWTGRVLLVGETPGYEERPFGGQAGQLLRRLCAEAQLGEDDVALVWAVRCQSAKFSKPTMKQLRACRPFLIHAVQRMQPESVIALGQHAVKALMNSGSCGSIARLRGKALQAPGLTPVIWSTYSPQSVIHGNLDHADRIVEDLRRPSNTSLPWPKTKEVKDDYVGLDSEFTPDGKVMTLAIANARTAESVPASKIKARLRQVQKIVGHSVAEDVTSLVNLGAAKEPWVKGLQVRDSLLIARMANENRGKGNYGVEALLRSGHNVQSWKEKTEVYGFDPSKWPDDLMLERCRLDAWAGYVVAEDFLKNARGPLVLAHRIALALKRVELAGAFIDMKAFGSFAGDVDTQVSGLKKKIEKIARTFRMPDFEPTNDHHLRELIYSKMGFTATRFTGKDQTSVAKIALKDFKDEHPYFNLQIEFNKYDKLQTTYCTALRARFQPATPALVGGVPVMWLPTRINPLGARTGRRSSGANPFEETDESGINYQNWPKQIRPIIRSRFPKGTISDNDYSKLEVILMGHEAGEEELVEFFSTSPNGYVAVGEQVFGKKVEPDTPDYRVMKSIILGVQYNMKKWKLAEQLRDQAGVILAPDWNDHVEEADKLRQKYLKRFPGIARFQRVAIEEVHRTGQIVGALGQTRRLPIPDEPPRSETYAWKQWKRHIGHIENEACNFKIQWLASLVTGTAMLDVEERLLSANQYTYTQYHEALLRKEWPRFPLLINEIHDDLVYDHPPERSAHWHDLIHTTMQELPTLRRLLPELKDVPIKVDSKRGPAWGVTTK